MRIFYVIILLKSVVFVESLRRLGFIGFTRYPLHSAEFPGILASKSSVRGKILNKNNQFYSRRLSKILAKNNEINENSASDDLFNCPGIDHIFSKSYVFSGGFEDLGVNSMLVRDLDHRKYSLETHKGLKKVIAILVSAVAVGLLYKFASFLKDVIEQQNIQLNTGHPLYNPINTLNQAN